MLTCPVEGKGGTEQEGGAFLESLQDTQPVGVLVDGCKTLDQVGVVAKAELLWAWRVPA